MKDIELVPGKAVAENGVVILDGPDGVAAAMTPEAARETAERLRIAAELAAAGRCSDQI